MTLTITIAVTVYFLSQLASHLILRGMTDWTQSHDSRVWATIYITGLDAIRLIALMTILYVCAF